MKGKAEYKPLTEERAVEVGSDLLGEAFLYSVAAAFIVYEYWRGVTKDQRHENVQNHKISDLQSQTQRLEQQMVQLQQTLDSLQTQLQTHSDSQTDNSNSRANSPSQQSSKSRSWWIW